MTKYKFSRREFVNSLWVLAGAAVITEMSLVGLRFLTPIATEGEFGGEFNLGNYDEFPAGSVTFVQAGRFYLVRLQDAGFMAVYHRCTHLGCSVPYDPSIQQFVCPCHGSAFTADGEVQNDPAPRPLDLFPLSINEDSEIIVDTQKSIERDKVEPSQIVYA